MDYLQRHSLKFNLQITLTILLIVLLIALGCSLFWNTKGEVIYDDVKSTYLEPDTILVVPGDEYFPGDTLRFIVKGGEILWLEY